MTDSDVSWIPVNDRSFAELIYQKHWLWKRAYWIESNIHLNIPEDSFHLANGEYHTAILWVAECIGALGSSFHRACFSVGWCRNSFAKAYIHATGQWLFRPVCLGAYGRYTPTVWLKNCWSVKTSFLRLFPLFFKNNCHFFFVLGSTARLALSFAIG